MANIEKSRFERAALVVADLQAEILPLLGAKADALLERTAGVIAAARAAKLPVIYIVVGFRPGYPEMARHSPMYAMLEKTGRLQTTTPGSDIHPAVRPHDGDLVIQKHRVGAFPGTSLDMVLRAQQRDTLILTGVSTSGVILSTVRAGFDADYKLFVVEDCVADADDEVHRVLTTKVFPRQATVVTAADLRAALG